MIYKECVVIPCACGFGVYQLGEANGEEYDDLDMLIAEMLGDCDNNGENLVLIERGDPRDIRGATHCGNEITRLFYSGERYFAILAFEEVEADE